MIAQPVRPHPEPDRLLKVHESAQYILDNPQQYWIFDSETTGLQGEFVEVALLGIDGRVAFSSLVKPFGGIEPSAHAVHGIRAETVSNAPTWPEITDAFRTLVRGRTLLVYNAMFDFAALSETYTRWALYPPRELRGACIMEMYATWFGQRYQRGYRWQKLVGGDHTALGDCRATLELIKRMAVPND